MEKFGTNARFLSNKSVTCEANHVKFKTLVQGSLAHMKATLICRNWRISTNNWKFSILGAPWQPRELIKVKFRTAKQTHVPLGHAKFHVNRCIKIKDCDSFFFSKLLFFFVSRQSLAESYKIKNKTHFEFYYRQDAAKRQTACRYCLYSEAEKSAF